MDAKTPEMANAASRPTPMMEQYLGIKAAYPDCLLFYRMGDFYELFFDDAESASKTLGIALTKRGKHLGDDIPMCGVPVRTAEEYMQKLIAGGHRVAVCDQTEDPAEAKKRGAKSVVQREVVRLVTQRTLCLTPTRATIWQPSPVIGVRVKLATDWRGLTSQPAIFGSSNPIRRACRRSWHGSARAN